MVLSHQFDLNETNDQNKTVNKRTSYYEVEGNIENEKDGVHHHAERNKKRGGRGQVMEYS